MNIDRTHRDSVRFEGWRVTESDRARVSGVGAPVGYVTTPGGAGATVNVSLHECECAVCSPTLIECGNPFFIPIPVTVPVTFL